MVFHKVFPTGVDKKMSKFQSILKTSGPGFFFSFFFAFL